MLYSIQNRRAYSIFELVVSFWLILILVGVFSIYAFKVLIAAKEVALQNELYNLRLSLELYKAFNRDNPKKLAQLYKIEDYFVLINRFDREGRLLDPFGNAYHYNPKNGNIRSTTYKYRVW